MVRRDELEPGIRFRIQNGAKFTLQDIQRMISSKANEYGIPISFRQDSISDNKLCDMLGLMKFECTVLYHPGSGKKAVGCVMTLVTEGTYLFINLSKSVYCNSNWAIIVEDIFKELFT